MTVMAKTEQTQSGLKTVVGLGKTGLSCVRYLKAQGCDVCVTDSREHPPAAEQLRSEFPDVELRLGAFDLDSVTRAHEVIVSPGVSLKEPVLQAAKDKNIRLLGDIELFRRAATAPIIAITGSNAKSTVTTLVGLMAEKAGVNVAVGGNIGTPVLELLGETEPDLYVLELSSFQLETVEQLKASVACVLNLSPDHMDRYDSMQAYMEAKHRIYTGCQRMVADRDDAMTRPMVPEDVPMFSFTLGEPELGEFGVREHQSESWLAFENDALMPVSELKVFGQHNVKNALSALAIGYAAGLEIKPMLEALREFKGLDHRCQWVAEINEVTFINDSKGTNIGATEAAIKSLASERKPNIVLIAGGDAKGADCSVLQPVLEKHVKKAVLIGVDAPPIKEAWDSACQCELAASMTEAVEKARENSEAGDIVLLSPACASFDMFKGFEDRGEQFSGAVKGLTG